MGSKVFAPWSDEINVVHVERRPWMATKRFVLGTPENLHQIIDECIASKSFAIDLEATGLDNRVFNGKTRDTISGICLSPDGVVGYYIPLYHVEVQEDGNREPRACNIPRSIFDPEFLRLIAAVDEGQTTARFHNAKFDQEFLQWNGGPAYGEWDKPQVWEDTMILAALRNSRARRIGLKDLAGAAVDAGADSQTGGPGLGMQMIELYELWGHETEKKDFRYDFSVLDPTDEACLLYACSDAICTWLLFDLLSKTPGVLEKDDFGFDQNFIYKIEKGCVTASRWMERNRIYIHKPTVLELIKLGQTEWMDAINTVYQEASKILNRDVTPGYYKYLRDHFKADPTCDQCQGKNRECSHCGGQGYDSNNLIENQIENALREAKKEPRKYGDPRGVHMGLENQEWPLIYDVNAPAQLGKMFEEMQVPGLQRTEKSGQVKTSKDEIERIIEEAGKDFPFMGKIRRFREVTKALSSYLYAMLLDSDPDDSTIRINFRQNKVDTGRFSTPAKEAQRSAIRGVPAINFQAIPRYDASGKDRPVSMGRLRECIRARKKKAKIVAINYSGEELRLITNLSGEPKWMKEFFHCAECDRMFHQGDGNSTPMAPPPFCPNCGSDKIGDLHTLTGLSIYGADARAKPDWKELRGKAKGLNFAMSYGGAASAAQRAVGCSKQEGARIKHQFDSTYSVLQRWWKHQHGFAKERGYVVTAFGRKYPVPDIYNPDGFFRSKAERNSVNGPIQGAGADVCKIAMALVYKECKRRGWLDKVMMIATMHDELVYEIDDDILEEAIFVLVPLMCRNPIILAQRWPIPLTSDVEFGDDWSVPYHFEKCRYGKNKRKVKTPEGEINQSYGFDVAIAHMFPNFGFPPGTEIPESALKAQAILKKELGIVPAETTPETPPPPPVPDEAPATGVPPNAIVPKTVASTAAPMAPTITTATAEGPPKLAKGEPYEFKLKVPLTLETVNRLAEVILKSRGKGTRVLKLVSAQGDSLDQWLEHANHGEPIIVSEVLFYAFAHERGLCN